MRKHAVTEHFLFTRHVGNARELVEALEVSARAAGCQLEDLSFNGMIRLAGSDGEGAPALIITKRNTP